MERQQFVRACSEGGALIERGLRQLQADYGGALLREAWLMLRDEASALDLLQDTLIKAWRLCSGFRAESELFPWLKQILRRTAIDQLRRRQPEVSLEDERGHVSPEVEAALLAAASTGSSAGSYAGSHAGAHDPTPQALAAAQHEAVFRRCAARFAQEQPLAAQAIRWLVEDDLDPAEIAVLLQRSPGATREFLSQCRKKARLYFAEWHRLVAVETSP